MSLNKFIELEFIHQLNLPRMQPHNAGFCFPCPFCFEGGSYNRKRRAFILTTDPNYNRFYCHNCGLDLSVRAFIERYDVSLFDEYKQKERKERLKGLKSGLFKKKQVLIPHEISETDLEYFDIPNCFSPVYGDSLALCKERKIPQAVIRKLYYCPVNSNILEKFKPLQDMLVFPFYNGDKIYGFQGRSIYTKRFHTMSQPQYKIYNIFNVDLKQPVYICESIIDSLFVDNSVAMLGNDISSTLIKKIENPVFVFDNDLKIETIKKLEKWIGLGYNVVLWPKQIKEKDVNEMIQHDKTVEEIKRIINKNNFSGLSAKVKLGIMKLGKMKT